MIRRQRFADLIWISTVVAILVVSAAQGGFWPRDPERTVSPLAAIAHSAGSGFAVTPALAITDAHFTRGCRLAGLPLSSPSAAGVWRVLYENPDVDLALLAAPAGAAMRPLPLSAVNRLVPGTPVVVLGSEPARGQITGETLTVHQPGTGLARNLQLSDAAGHMVAPTWQDGLDFFGAENAGRLRWVVQIAAGSRPGDSGGPVVDNAGAVIGVVFAGRPEGPTSAVVLSDLEEFLSRAGVGPAFAAPADGAPDPAAARVAAGGVIHLEC